MQPIVSESWPHPKLDAHIKPQPTNEKCWRQADRRIKSNQPIRESRVFRAQTARQLANQGKQGLSRPNCEAAGSDYKKAPPGKSAVSASLRQTPRDSARLRQIQSDSAGHLRAVTVTRGATSPDSAAEMPG